MNAIKTLGPHFLVGINGPQLSSREVKILGELQPLGIILFAKNVDQAAGLRWPEKLKELISSCIDATNREKLLVSIDHEGGRVQRLPSPCTEFPYPRYWREKSFDVGRAMARELRALSINLSFAPVLDVDSEPQNEVISERAFGTEEKEIWQWAAPFIEGIQSQGVMCCGKHFPGHGATVEDSHFVLPVLHADKKEMTKRDLVPFCEAIKAKIPLLMTAHVSYPKLDSEPATLSRKILTELLREELGYKGALISDDLEMKALDYLTPAEKAVSALQAGVDILLEGNPETQPAVEVAWEMAVGLAKAVDQGTLRESVLEDSQKRIETLVQQAKDLVDTSELRSDYPLDLIGCEEHKAVLAGIE